MNFEDSNFLWDIIGENKFCSFKYSTIFKNYCKNKYNLTGRCNKQSCPLVNPKYATIIEKEGKFFLIKKIPEKIQFPNKTWAKIPLSRNYIKAFQQIDLNLVLWPKFFQYKTKQKLTKLHQIKVRKKINLLKFTKKKLGEIPLVGEHKKNLKVTFDIDFEKKIEYELLNRLHIGVYGKLYTKLPIQIIRDDSFDYEKIRGNIKTEKTILKGKNIVNTYRKKLTI